MEFHEITDNLPETPAFNYFGFDDVNPLSKKKKRRIIGNPNKGMRIVHARFLHYLRALKISLPSATGAVIGSSPIRNLERHRQAQIQGNVFNRHFYLLDICNAYQSVNSSKLIDIIVEQSVGLRQADVEGFMQNHCLSERGGLIVGAPSSPDLFNLYSEFVLDQTLRKLCWQYHISYSRYLDDITFSASRPIGKKKRRALRQVIIDAPFEINHRKAQVFDLNRGDAVINGVGIRRNGETFLPRHALREIRGLLHSFLAGRPVNPHVIIGKMGLFIHLTDCYRPNLTESKILDQYYEFRMKLRDSQTSPA